MRDTVACINLIQVIEGCRLLALAQLQRCDLKLSDVTETQTMAAAKASHFWNDEEFCRLVMKEALYLHPLHTGRQANHQ